MLDVSLMRNSPFEQLVTTMIYEIKLKGVGVSPDDIDLLHDNPHSALEAFQLLQDRLGSFAVMVLKDDIQITDSELATDIESYDIQIVLEQETQLPSTYRHGRGGDSDLAVGGDGNRHGVWKPRNPEDDYN
jgi:hypothetical protein